MTISLNMTTPAMVGDFSAPLSSYVSDGFPVLMAQFYSNFTNGDLYFIKDCTDQNALVWNKIAFVNAAVYSSPSFSSITTATQLSTTRDASVNYVFPTSMTSLIASQSLTATLQYADDAGMTTNVVTVSSDVTGCAGILSLTLNGRLQLSGRIPAGKYRKVTLSQSGGATIPTTISSSQEVLL